MTDEVTTRSYDGWIGRDAYDSTGERIGTIKNLYYDDATGRPEWAEVKTGMFTGTRLVPLQGSGTRGDGLQLGFTKDAIKQAPDVAIDDEHLDPAREATLWSYYGYDYGSVAETDYGYGTAYTEPRADDAWREDWERRHREGAIGAIGTSDEIGTEAEVTLAEERMTVGTERVETGRARLRKYVITENQTVTVPVTREEVRIEREPIVGGEPGVILDESAETEMILHEERPVVGVETVATEKVRLAKDTVLDEETFTEEVRKEVADIDVEDEARRDA